MENLTLELGSAHPFWSLAYYRWAALATPSWITSTWQDLAQIELRLSGPIPTLTPQRINALMDVFIANDFHPTSLLAINPSTKPVCSNKSFLSQTLPLLMVRLSMHPL